MRWQASQSVILNWGFQYLSCILNYFKENADMLKIKLFYDTKSFILSNPFIEIILLQWNVTLYIPKVLSDISEKI